jgi:hypothetical protein
MFDFIQKLTPAETVAGIILVVTVVLICVKGYRWYRKVVIIPVKHEQDGGESLDDDRIRFDCEPA